MTYQFCCDATELGVRAVILRLMDTLAKAGVCENVHSSVGIAVTEALNNIVEHALSDRADGKIDLELSLDAAQIFVLLQDNGGAMPGWQTPAGQPADLSGARADLPESGFGWTLIRALADEVDYSRINGLNRLKLWFPIPAKPTAPPPS